MTNEQNNSFDETPYRAFLYEFFGDFFRGCHDDAWRARWQDALTVTNALTDEMQSKVLPDATNVLIGGDPQQCSRDEICLGAIDSRRSIVVGKNIRERFSRIADSLSGWTLSDLEVKVAVANDLGQKVSVYIPSCFVENDRGRWSYHDYSIDWDADTTYTFSLSDAGVDQAFSDNVSSILSFLNKRITQTQTYS